MPRGTVALEVDSYENRGTDEVPYGFVNFNDGSRVGYSDGRVWQPRTNGGGKYQGITNAHLGMAAKLLVEEGIIKP